MLLFKQFTEGLRLATNYNYIDATGTVVPDTDTLLSAVQSEFQTAFGSDLDLTPSSPQGILITAEVLDRASVLQNNADIANQINPNLASGIFLDAICAMSGIERIKATHSTVTATCTGTAGVIIYSGAQAQTANGDLFECITSTTIPVGGSIDVAFQSVETGPIPCVAGALNTITTAILGWTGVTNTDAALLGTAEESDASLWLRRKNTLATQGTQTSEAIISALYNTDGVQSLTFMENYKNTTQVIDTISMKPHSIYCCVNGGLDADVAQAILDNRSAGSDFNGSTSVNITATSGQVIAIKFDRPTTIPILHKITVKLSGASGDVTTTIKNQILNYVNGKIDGEKGFVVGGSVSPFELAGVVSTLSGVYVQKSEIALASSGVYQTSEIPIAINQIATLSSSAITVVVL